MVPQNLPSLSGRRSSSSVGMFDMIMMLNTSLQPRRLFSWKPYIFHVWAAPLLHPWRPRWPAFIGTNDPWRGDLAETSIVSL